MSLRKKKAINYKVYRATVTSKKVKVRYVFTYFEIIYMINTSNNPTTKINTPRKNKKVLTRSLSS